MAYLWRLQEKNDISKLTERYNISIEWYIPSPSPSLSPLTLLLMMPSLSLSLPMFLSVLYRGHLSTAVCLDGERGHFVGAELERVGWLKLDWVKLIEAVSRRKVTTQQKRGW